MQAIGKLETTIAAWFKNAPHLPEVARTWIANNIWWIVIIGLVLSAIAAVSLLFGTLLGSAVTVYILPAVAAWQLITGIVSLVFLVLEIIILAAAIKPLQLKQKKGWTLLFILWVVSALSVVVNAVLSLNPFGFVVALLFGAIGLAIGGYFLFEIRGNFSKVIKSPGVKAGDKA